LSALLSYGQCKPVRHEAILFLTEEYPKEILVFDVGGSHIAAGVFNFLGGTVETLSHLVVPAGVSSDDFFFAFLSLRDSLLVPATPLSGIAVAIPNPFDLDRGVSYMQHKYRQLYGVDLRRGLSKRLGCDPARIHFLNDAAAFLIGEIDQGAAAGCVRSVGITLGTGVGSAFAVSQDVVTSGTGVSAGGEIWNLAYRDGIVEDVISTATIQKEYARLTGVSVEVREIANLARTQPEARHVFETFGRELGQVVRHTCSGFAPERVVLGGGISRTASIFLSSAEKEIADLNIRLLVSSLFERAPLVGAAISWQRKYLPESTLRNHQPNNFAEQT
jgi:glucokinase